MVDAVRRSGAACLGRRGLPANLRREENPRELKSAVVHRPPPSPSTEHGPRDLAGVRWQRRSARRQCEHGQGPPPRNRMEPQPAREALVHPLLLCTSSRKDHEASETSAPITAASRSRTANPLLRMTEPASTGGAAGSLTRSPS